MKSGTHKARGGEESALPVPREHEAAWMQRLVGAALEARYGGAFREAQSRELAPAKPLRALRVVSSLTQGGVGKVCLQTVLAMDRAEVETSLLVFGEKPRQVERWADRVGARVQAVALRIAPYDRPWDFWRGVRDLSARIEAARPHVVHVHEPQFALAARAAVGRAARRGVPSKLVVQLHNDYRRRTGAMPGQLVPAIQRALRESALIACSRTIESAARDWLGAAKLNLTLIEDGADDQVVGRDDGEPEPTPAADLRAAAAGRPVAACMANLVPHKRIEDFIEACGRLNDEGTRVYALLMVYGKREAAAAMRRRFEARIPPGTGQMLYRVGQPHGLLKEVAVGVSPSALEGLGLNILEYQAQGVPVVCTDLPPHREMVEDGVSGLLYPVADVAALAAAMRRLILDRALSERLGRAGREAASRRKWEHTAARTAELYRRLIGG